MSLKSEVLRGYRKLFRTSRIVFLNDYETQRNAAKEIRNAFKSNINETDDVKIADLVKEIGEAEKFAREHLVQCKLKDDESGYEAVIKHENIEASEKGGLATEGCSNTKDKSK